MIFLSAIHHRQNPLESISPFVSYFPRDKRNCVRQKQRTAASGTKIRLFWTYNKSSNAYSCLWSWCENTYYLYAEPNWLLACLLLCVRKAAPVLDSIHLSIYLHGWHHSNILTHRSLWFPKRNGNVARRYRGDTLSPDSIKILNGNLYVPF
jgi:hypothetical protein